MTSLQAAAFSRTPFTIEVRGVRLSWPYANAETWLARMADAQWATEILSSMDAVSYDAMLEALLTEQLVRDDLRQVLNQAMGAAGGRPWWEVQRLTGGVLAQDGKLMGRLALAGVQPATMSLAVYLAAAWAAITQGLTGADLMKAEAELMAPPPEITLEEARGLEMSTTQIVSTLRGLPGVSIG